MIQFSGKMPLKIMLIFNSFLLNKTGYNYRYGIIWYLGINWFDNTPITPNNQAPIWIVCCNVIRPCQELITPNYVGGNLAKNFLFIKTPLEYWWRVKIKTLRKARTKKFPDPESLIYWANVLALESFDRLIRYRSQANIHCIFILCYSEVLNQYQICLHLHTQFNLNHRNLYLCLRYSIEDAVLQFDLNYDLGLNKVLKHVI